MNIETIREYCLSLPETTESFPFDEVTLVFKVANKIFALANLDGELTINLKCNPEKAIEIREKYSCVTPGYHMSKAHWNTVTIDGSISDKLILEWIEHSYFLVVSKLNKMERLRINNKFLKIS
jgi:predicted DNA-binding protein (MmcQ/YjbR family)